MSDKTKIQWCDSTVNPIMGCYGCELFLRPTKTLNEIAKAIRKTESPCKTTKEDIKTIVGDILDEVFAHSHNSHSGHMNKVTTSNIWHLRHRLLERISRKHGEKAAALAKTAIRKSVTCYAGKLHLNKASNILDREGTRVPARKTNPGYSPVFEKTKRFGGRVAKAAQLPDLLGRNNTDTPWKGQLPRMLFVSDMGDAFCNSLDFGFLKADTIPAITSEDGMRHLWLWLTKRPARMAKFAEEVGGFPPNVCAMTTLTGLDSVCRQRLDALKGVKASVKGLSIEPLRKRILPCDLDLEGIDWVIIGGESGAREVAHPFYLKWAEDIIDLCRAHGVACFVKQLGRNPTRGKRVLQLQDSHGGDWSEWDEHLRIREFPQYFHNYRKSELINSSIPRPATAAKSP